MQLAKRSISVALLCALGLSGCADPRGNGTDLSAYRAERSREVEALVARATPGGLATAAWLALPLLPSDAVTEQPLELIGRAEALAPQRPELVWLHLAICKRLKCDTETQIEDHLKALDPGNGFVWTWDLEHAQTLGSDASVSEAILRIGASPRMTHYWNQLEVMMVDALAIAEPSQGLATRGVYAIGMLSAAAIPPLQPLAKACRLEQLDQPGRRDACETLISRMEQSSSVITQSLALSLQERWWPASSPQRDLLRVKRRQLDYEMVMSSQTRWRMNRDMAIRIDAARRYEREEDVMLAVLKAYRIPTEPPTGWNDTLHAG